MGDDRPADLPGQGEPIPQPAPPPGWQGPAPGWPPPAWAPPGWGSTGPSGAQPPGWGSPGAPGAQPPGWGPAGPSGAQSPGWGSPGAPGAQAPGWGPPPPWGGPVPPGWSGGAGSTGASTGPGVAAPHRGLRLVALVAGAVVLAAAVGIPTAILVSRTGGTTTPAAGSTATPTPSQSAAAAAASALYNKVISRAEGSAGFHYVATTGTGSATSTITGDAGQSDGSQVLSMTTSFGHEQFDLLLAADQTVYFEGNVPALEDQLGVSASAAPALAGSWISVKIGDGPYKELEVGITVGSQLSEDSLVPSSSQQVTVAGSTVTRVKGTVPATDAAPAGTAHLDVSPGTDLPATFVVSYGSSSETSTTVFSNWGTAPMLTLPSSAVAWVSLSTTSPPAGYGSGETATPAPTPTPQPGSST